MENKDMLTIRLEDGTKEEVEILISFKFSDNNNEYVIYTKNETDENGNVTIYVSHIDRTGEEPMLTTVSDEAEWARIKDVLRELSKNE